MKHIKKVSLITLPNVVFYPNTALPLYVVDEIYETLIKDSITQSIPVAVSMSLDGELNSDPFSQPNEICGAGIPLILEKMDDGVLKVLMKGTCKVKLLELDRTISYPQYWAEVITEKRIPFSQYNLKVERLQAILIDWLTKNVTNQIERSQFIQTMTTPCHIIDYVATFLIRDRNLRQILLENNSYYEKINLLDVLIQDYLPYQEDIFVSEAVKDFDSIEKISKLAN